RPGPPADGRASVDSDRRWRSAAQPTTPARRSFGERDLAAWRRRPAVDLVLVELILAEVHLMRSAETLLDEVDGKERGERLAVPTVRLQELLVVLAGLVPVREQRGREVHALAVPGLRHHVHLRADLLLVHERGVMRIGDVEDTRRAVHERVDE